MFLSCLIVSYVIWQTEWAVVCFVVLSLRMGVCYSALPTVLVRSVSVVLLTRRPVKLLLLPVEVTIHMTLCQIFRWLDGVMLATVAVPARNVGPFWAIHGVPDDLVYSVLLIFLLVSLFCLIGNFLVGYRQFLLVAAPTSHLFVWRVWQGYYRNIFRKVPEWSWDIRVQRSTWVTDDLSFRHPFWVTFGGETISAGGSQRRCIDMHVIVCRTWWFKSNFFIVVQPLLLL